MCLAIPARVVEVSSTETSRALIEVGSARRSIDTGLLAEDPVRVGDWVLVHVGFALSKISEEQAREQLSTLAKLGESEAAIQEVTGYGGDSP